MAKRKKKSLLKATGKILLSLVALMVSAYYIINFFSQSPHIKYPAFGIDIPPNFELHGIDVSHYQHIIDWMDVKQMQVNDIRIGFAFIKATEGIEDVDEQFRRNWLQAERAAIVKGAYHFFVPGKSGTLQAHNFVEIVKLKQGDLPPVLDVEQDGHTSLPELQKEVKQWLDEVERYYGVKPVIYTNIDFYKNYLEGTFDEYPLWIAHYLQPEKPRILRTWIFWQHSESGRVNGIRTSVDFNVFAGDSAAFNNLLIK